MFSMLHLQFYIELKNKTNLFSSLFNARHAHTVFCSFVKREGFEDIQ